MHLRDTFAKLSEVRQREVHLALCGQSLLIWQEYISAGCSLAYVDSVVGMRHTIDDNLPSDAMESVRRGTDVANVNERYKEPIVAMHDGDLNFPDHVEFAYYSIYNCFQKYVAGADINSWLIVNQALSCSKEQDEWVLRLSRAMTAAT